MPNPLLNATNVSVANPQFTALLTNLQGHILKHHGRTHAYHIFIQFKPAKIAEAKTWIRNFANTKIISADKQLRDAERRHTDKTFDAGLFHNFSLAHSGYVALGIPNAKIPNSDTAFTDGQRTREAILSDNVDKWEAPFKKTIDALIIVADNNEATALSDRDLIINELKKFSLVIKVQKGKILENSDGIGIEHFGYADGVSQPNFLALTTPQVPAPTQWDDNGAILNTVLVEEKGTNVADSFGSFYVFRKLEQNVKKFKNREKSLPSVKDKFGSINDELAGAMIVGRFEDGSEVINHSKEKGITQQSQLNNDFDYRNDAVGSSTNGSKCPFHAHIRVTNPRADVSQSFAKSVRLTRRGIPYNDIGRDETNLEGDQPTKGVGLLFQCYQSSIVNQFEFIQQSWANDGNIGGRFVGQDAIIGQGANSTPKSLPIQWGIAPNSQPVSPTFRDFVKMKGGEYFFTPSISFLRNI
jgi:Dyp-type peroxidase family